MQTPWGLKSSHHTSCKLMNKPPGDERIYQTEGKHRCFVHFAAQPGRDGRIAGQSSSSQSPSSGPSGAHPLRGWAPWSRDMWRRGAGVGSWKLFGCCELDQKVICEWSVFFELPGRSVETGDLDLIDPNSWPASAQPGRCPSTSTRSHQVVKTT